MNWAGAHSAGLFFFSATTAGCGYLALTLKNEAP